MQSNKDIFQQAYEKKKANEIKALNQMYAAAAIHTKTSSAKRRINRLQTYIANMQPIIKKLYLCSIPVSNADVRNFAVNCNALENRIKDYARKHCYNVDSFWFTMRDNLHLTGGTFATLHETANDFGIYAAIDQSGTITFEPNKMLKDLSQ